MILILTFFAFDLGIHPTNQQQKNETLRRGMSMAVPAHEKPAPPVRRTPSMSVNAQTSTRIQYKSTQATVQLNTIEDFPPPPPDFLLSEEPKLSPPRPPPPPQSSANDPHTSLLSEIQRGFKLRKTTIQHDRSAPRIR